MASSSTVQPVAKEPSSPEQVTLKLVQTPHCTYTMVELRSSKRSATGEDAAPPPKKLHYSKRTNHKVSRLENIHALVDAENGKYDAPDVGTTINLRGFGGKVLTDENEEVTLQQLLDQSNSGVILFTYPRASTPGCTTQACLFRDSYDALTSTGLAIYGLSTDKPPANTKFKIKYRFPYTLLCDPRATLIQAIGLKKIPTGTQRGVFAVNKKGQVLVSEAAGPAASVEIIRKLVVSLGGKDESKGIEKAEQRAFEAEGDEVEDRKIAETAAEVAESAANVDVARSAEI